MATGYWFYLWQPKVKVEIAVKGGRIVASTATQDIGTGTRSVLADTVAREFDLEASEVEVRIGDSSLPKAPAPVAVASPPRCCRRRLRRSRS